MHLINVFQMSANGIPTKYRHFPPIKPRSFPSPLCCYCHTFCIHICYKPNNRVLLLPYTVLHVTLEVREEIRKPKYSMLLLSCVQLFVTPCLQPTRLLCPWDFPCKNTGVSCHSFSKILYEVFYFNPFLPSWTLHFSM